MRKPRIAIPATVDDQLSGIDLAHSFYHPSIARSITRRMLGIDISVIRREVMIRAFEKNPYSGLVALDRNGEAIGFFEAWSINAEKLESLLRGDIEDADLELDDFNELSQIHNRVYVGMTVPVRSSDEGLVSFTKQSLLALMYAATRVFELIYFPRESVSGILQLYALAVTTQGKCLLEDLGFQDKSRFYKRRDGKLVYGRDVTKVWVDKLRADYKLVPSRFEIREAVLRGSRSSGLRR